MENSVAVFLNGAPVYWHSVIIAIAVAAAIACASLLRTGQTGSPSDIWSVALIGFLPAMLLGRVYYCYFAQESFSDRSEMYRLGMGGYALYGVMAGYLLTALIFCRLKKKKLAPLLDAIAPAAALGIAIGRAASYFSGDDFGVTINDPELQRFPYATYSESRGEWSFAVFVFEAITALVVFAVLMLLFSRRDSARFRYRDGDVMLMFAFLYGVPQTVFESMRNDSLFLISLGFVRISQVISILMATVVFVIFSIRSAKRGVTRLHVLGWFFCLTRIALAFWMEFCITNDTVVRNYTIMSLCLLFYIFVGLALYFDGSAADSAQPAAVPAADIAVVPSPQPQRAEPVQERLPDDFRADVPIRTYNILREASGDDFSAGSSAGRYMVRLRAGVPGSRVRAAYPITAGAVINVRTGKVQLQDIFDLMGFDLDCVSDYSADMPNGLYHVTACVLYPGEDNTADPRNIYLYFSQQHSSPANRQNVPPDDNQPDNQQSRPSEGQPRRHDFRPAGGQNATLSDSDTERSSEPRVRSRFNSH